MGGHRPVSGDWYARQVHENTRREAKEGVSEKGGGEEVVATSVLENYSVGAPRDKPGSLTRIKKL